MKITQDQLNQFTQWFEKYVGRVGELDGKAATHGSITVAAFIEQYPEKKEQWLRLNLYSQDIRRGDFELNSVYRFLFEVDTSYPYKEEG